jgi:serine/threonine protein phosphatase PrpC
LDEKCLKECDGKDKRIQKESSPISDRALTPATPVSLDPQKVIKQAMRKVSEYGSSTACVASLNGRSLKVANLGDSALIVVRYFHDQNKAKVLMQTEEQQHNFNAPYQLANIPDSVKRSQDSSRQFWKDKASDCVIYQTSVREGDIIISGTDGLFDNLYVKEITNIIDVFMNECMANSENDSLPSVRTNSNTPELSQSQLNLMTRKNAKKLAQELVKTAYRKSKSSTCFTPFADKFDKTGIKKDNEVLKWKGGKPDDI